MDSVLYQSNLLFKTELEIELEGEGRRGKKEDVMDLSVS